MDTKICSKCKEKKPVGEFSRNKTQLDGYQNQCKACMKIAVRNWKIANKEREIKNNHNYYANNKEKIGAQHKAWYALNKEQVANSVREWRLNNKERTAENARKYMKKRKAIDPIFKLKCRVRTLIGDSFKNKNLQKNIKTETILGIDIPTFRLYLLSTFLMNYGRPYDPNIDIVHIDHIIPIATAVTEDDVVRLCHYSNLQLLLAQDNLKKSNKIT